MSAKVQQENGEVCSSGDASLLPHLESLDRMLKLPVVDATWQQTQNVYGRVKGTFPKKLWQIFREVQLLENDIYQFYSDPKVLFTPGYPTYCRLHMFVVAGGYGRDEPNKPDQHLPRAPAQK